MKLEAQLFGVTARILRGEEILDAVRDIANVPGQEEPFAVLDVGDVILKIKSWRIKMPRVKPFYAVKCNSNPTVLRTLALLGTGFDVASKAEMKAVLEMGVTPSRMIFAHPCKPASHLRAACAAGVRLLTFDNEAELAKVKDIMPEARLVIRIRCDAASAQCPLGEKFGVEPAAVGPLLVTARSLRLDLAGVSFHVGSGCKEPGVFARAIREARRVFDLAREMGFEPSILDIGGGFPGRTGAVLNDVARIVNAALDEHFPEDDIEVIAEPGRYVVASAFTLATHVVSKRRVEPQEPQRCEPSFMYYINDGVYGSFNCILYDHYTPSPLPLDLGTPSAETPPTMIFESSIWGPTCDSLDKVVGGVSLPEMNVGDWIAWRDMGAYTMAAAGTFNGFPPPQVRVVVPLHSWLFLESLLTADASKEGDTPLPAPQQGGRQAGIPRPYSKDHPVLDAKQLGVALQSYLKI